MKANGEMPNGSRAPIVTIIVPVRNGEATIVGCVESLLALDYPKERIQIVIVDNASTDATVEKLTPYRNRITVLREEKRGAAAARNRGLIETIGEVVAFTDADCEVGESWIERLVAPLLEDDRIGLVGGRILSRRPANFVELFGEEIHDHQRAITVSTPPYAITMNWASPRSVLLEVGFFDEDFIRCEDVELSRRIFSAGYEGRFEGEAIVYHRNETNFGGLFREGLDHGMWAVRLMRENRGSEAGGPRLDLGAHVRIVKAFFDAARGRDPGRSLCFGFFHLGKKVGKLLGSVRFGYLHL